MKSKANYWSENLLVVLNATVERLNGTNNYGTVTCTNRTKNHVFLVR